MRDWETLLQDDEEEPSLEYPETGNYRAFNPLRINEGKLNRLDIRRKNNTGTIICYCYISTIEYSGNELISLIYHEAVITLTGKHLGKLRDALQDERVRYIQELPSGVQVTEHEAVIDAIQWRRPKSFQEGEDGEAETG